MAKEDRKRLAPTFETLRELYLKSGNRCAFPNCTSSIFNDQGKYIGQICHIESAEPGGERFSENQTNEECRSISNLMLMCYPHHVETNDVIKYPVERMQRIKAEHERKYSDVIGVMLIEVADHTKLTAPVMAKSLEKMNAILHWGHGKHELEKSADDINIMAARLAKIPEPSRKLLQIIIERGKKGDYGVELAVGIGEIKQATGLSVGSLRECISILDTNGFIFNNEKNGVGEQMIGVSNIDHDWAAWKDIRDYCAKAGISLSYIIISLDFSVLD